MNLTTKVAGSVEAPVIAASNAWNVNACVGNVRIAKVTVTDPHSVFSKDLPYLHHVSVPPPKHLHTYQQHLRGVASVCAITQDTRRWIAPRGNFAASVGEEVTSTS